MPSPRCRRRFPGLGTHGRLLALAAGPQRRHDRVPRPEPAEVPRRGAAAARAGRRDIHVQRRRSRSSTPTSIATRSLKQGVAADRRLPDDAGVSRRPVRQPVQPVRPAVAGLPAGRRRRTHGAAASIVAVLRAQQRRRHGSAVDAADDGPTFGPQYTNRFNVYRAAQVTGGRGAGYSSGQALDAARRRVARRRSRREFGYDCVGPVLPGDEGRRARPVRSSRCRSSSSS